MNTTRLEPIYPLSRGIYSSTTTYNKGDYVFANDNTYYCFQNETLNVDPTTTDPTDTSVWGIRNEFMSTANAPIRDSAFLTRREGSPELTPSFSTDAQIFGFDDGMPQPIEVNSASALKGVSSLSINNHYIRSSFNLVRTIGGKAHGVGVIPRSAHQNSVRMESLPVHELLSRVFTNQYFFFGITEAGTVYRGGYFGIDGAPTAPRVIWEFFPMTFPGGVVIDEIFLPNPHYGTNGSEANYVFFRDTNANIYFMGNNTQNASTLGISTGEYFVPTLVPSLANTSRIIMATNNRRFFRITSDNELQGWGDNSMNRLGVPALSGVNVANPTTIATGVRDLVTCSVDDEQTSLILGIDSAISGFGDQFDTDGGITGINVPSGESVDQITGNMARETLATFMYRTNANSVYILGNTTALTADADVTVSGTAQVALPSGVIPRTLKMSQNACHVVDDDGAMFFTGTNTSLHGGISFTITADGGEAQSGFIRCVGLQDGVLDFDYLNTNTGNTVGNYNIITRVVVGNGSMHASGSTVGNAIGSGDSTTTNIPFFAKVPIL